MPQIQKSKLVNNFPFRKICFVKMYCPTQEKPGKFWCWHTPGLILGKILRKFIQNDEYKLHITSPDLIWAQRALGKTLPKALKFKPSFVVFVLMERFQNKKMGVVGLVGITLLANMLSLKWVLQEGGWMSTSKIFFFYILTLTAKRLCDFTIKTLP